MALSSAVRMSFTRSKLTPMVSGASATLGATDGATVDCEELQPLTATIAATAMIVEVSFVSFIVNPLGESVVG
jgi:hypothetical protein